MDKVERTNELALDLVKTDPVSWIFQALDASPTMGQADETIRLASTALLFRSRRTLRVLVRLIELEIEDRDKEDRAG